MSELERSGSGSQFELFKTERFRPFFITQFLGAFNDNIFKNALMLLLAFSAVENASEADTSILLNIAAGLFVLPFFLFSATAGQLADKYEKSAIIRKVKLLEIVVMALGSYALFVQNTTLLLFVLFLMGTQSAFFGPVKYAIIPQHLKPEELVGGNAQVEMGTFVAILLGTIGGGLVAGLDQAAVVVSVAVISVAILGYFFSRKIPEAAAADPELKIQWNPYRSTRQLLKMANDNYAVLLAIMGISWFWFLGSSYLTQLPNYAKTELYGDGTVVTALLCCFTVGVAIGSLLCERLSGHKVEIGLVPFGAIGLTVFGMDLYAASSFAEQSELLSVFAFFALDGSFRVALDLLFIGAFGGFYIVPLYAMVQQRSDDEVRARMIAVNNVLNAFFMVVGAIAGVLMLGVAGLSIPQFFLVIALLNVVVAVFIFQQIPEFAMRFLIWLLTHTMYRVKHQGLERIPDEGAAVIVCNHVSFVDALLLAGAVRRPIRFIMFKPIFEIPVLNFIFRTGRAIPIISQHVDKDAYEKAFADIREGLQEGDLLCIFPEGKLTTTGEMNEFKGGIERILEETPVQVIPMALRGLWGSFFSHRDGPALATWPKRIWSKVEIVASDAVPPEKATPQQLHEQVLALRGEWR